MFLHQYKNCSHHSLHCIVRTKPVITQIQFYSSPYHSIALHIVCFYTIIRTAPIITLIVRKKTMITHILFDSNSFHSITLHSVCFYINLRTTPIIAFIVNDNPKLVLFQFISFHCIALHIICFCVISFQLLYTGMLETTKIRREGYAIRPVFSDFVEKYACLTFYSTSRDIPGKLGSGNTLNIIFLTIM